MASICLNILFVCGVLFLNDSPTSRFFLCALQIICSFLIGYNYLLNDQNEMLNAKYESQHVVFSVLTVFPTLLIAAFFYFIPNGVALNYFILAAIAAVFTARVLLRKSRSKKEDIITIAAIIIIIIVSIFKGTPTLFEK